MTVAQHSRSSCSCETANWRYGGPSRSEHPWCERPGQLVCLGCSAVVAIRCGRSSRNACEPCSITYRRRVRRIFLSGWTDNPSHRLGLLTLTAPGDRQHTDPNGDTCPCTPVGGVYLPAWNAEAGKCFNRFMQDLRRAFGEVQYCRAAEVQKRGALHFHVLIRTTEQAFGTPGTRRLWASDQSHVGSPLRLLAIKHGFGHEVDLQLVRTEGAAGYCAKYVSKSADDRETLPWIDRATGEVVTGVARYRPWSSSRRWSDVTMLALRLAQAEWVRARLAEEAAAQAERPEPPPPVGEPTAAGLDLKTQSYTTGPRYGPPSAAATTASQLAGDLR